MAATAIVVRASRLRSELRPGKPARKMAFGASGTHALQRTLRCCSAGVHADVIVQIVSIPCPEMTDPRTAELQLGIVIIAGFSFLVFGF